MFSIDKNEVINLQFSNRHLLATPTDETANSITHFLIWIAQNR